MAQFKAGVDFSEMHSRILAALPEIDAIHKRTIGRAALITSGREGTHSANSLHYKGRAVDFRTRDLADTTKQRLWNHLKDRFDRDFDIVLEATHIHFEYDPK